MKIAICDDDGLFRQTLKDNVIGYCQEKRIAADVYEFDANDPYTSSDKGMKLGKVVSENNSSSESMYIWSVKGTKDYIYRVWGLYDGGFYKKVE